MLLWKAATSLLAADSGWAPLAFCFSLNGGAVGWEVVLLVGRWCCGLLFHLRTSQESGVVDEPTEQLVAGAWRW